MEGKAAERLQKCFSPGVIGIKHKGGKKRAVVNDSRYDTSSRNVFRHEDLKDAVIMSKVQDHFICKFFFPYNSLFEYPVTFIVTIESVGALTADAIFVEAVTILKNKCLNLLEELNK